jgi:hypothetical protein
MAEVTHVIGVAPSRVFAVLADGWAYPLWVVGATHMRDVDDNWPQIGSRIHHSVGIWPLLLEDHTEVVDMQPDQRLELAARAWPTGTARIVLSLKAVPQGTQVPMTEEADSGPARLLPAPIQSALLGPRNREALLRLDSIATHRSA